MAIVDHARCSKFYEDLGVPDTLDCRFEMIVLHAYIVFRRLRQLGKEGADIAQTLFDVMFADMDRNLRELGVGDLGVGRRVKKMAERFYGSVQAYDTGLDMEGDGELAAAVARNLYAGADPSLQSLADMSAYLRREVAALDALPGDKLLKGHVHFGVP